MMKIFAPLVLLFFISCNNETDQPAVTDEPAKDAPAAISYSVVDTYPHDTTSYTQGLLFYKGELYEGTGTKGRSHLMKVDLKTGRPLKKIPLDADFFGEGVTILRDTVYQLTWEEHVVFVYTLPDFKKIKEYKLTTDGWGLTTDGVSLIVSDGTNTLYYYDPSTFALQRTQSITESGQPAFNLNELEMIDGFIYANQYLTSNILRIDPKSGVVVGKVNMEKLSSRAAGLYSKGDVLNGIAYDSTTKKIYVTGKLWPELYQVEFSK